MKLNKGFTLIELLVVIAIIGVLSSVVLASVQNARTKAADAAIKANLGGARAQADLFYDSSSNSYASVCGTTAASDGTKTINAQVLAAAGQTGLSAINTTLATAGTGITATCHAAAAAWAAEAPLKASTSGTPSMYCIDSTGQAKTESAALGASATVCA